MKNTNCVQPIQLCWWYQQRWQMTFLSSVHHIEHVVAFRFSRGCTLRAEQVLRAPPSLWLVFKVDATNSMRNSFVASARPMLTPSIFLSSTPDLRFVSLPYLHPGLCCDGSKPLFSLFYLFSRANFSHVSARFLRECFMNMPTYIYFFCNAILETVILKCWYRLGRVVYVFRFQ